MVSFRPSALAVKLPAILVILVSLLHGTLGQELPAREADDLEQRFFRAQQGHRTLTAAFTQTVTAPGLPAPVVSEGHVYYRAPDSLLVEYTSPAGDFLQLQGNRFTTRRSGDKIATRSADHPSARALVALRDVLRGQPPAEEMVRRVTREGAFFRVTLNPSFAGPDTPGMIENLVEAKSLQLRSLGVSLPRGAVMTFDFRQIRTNRSLPSGLFSTP